MGFLDAVKSVTGIGQPQYRTHVMYDFSIVTKAKFYVYVKTSGGQLKLEDELPVQINPSETKYSIKSKIDPIECLADGGEDSPADSLAGSPFKIGGVQGSSFDVDLIFDVFDEYMARTANDTLPLDTVSILDPEVVICQKLHSYTGQSDIVLRYCWGESVDVFGQIKDLDIEINCFSRWGTPLKGTAKLTLSIIEYPNTGIKIDKTNAARIKEFAEIASLVASEALR